MPAEPLLEVDGLDAAWGRTPVLRGISFTVAPGEVLSLLGPNGSGKSTLLRVIAGFEPPAAGTVRLGGRDLAGVPPHRRSIGLLFQDPTLFAQRTVLQNIAYAPLLQRRPEREIRELVGRLSELLSLTPLLDRRPHQLSGGEAQRVALARSLAARPRLVLLDEPFASVDVEVRAGLRASFRAALRDLGTAAVHVTHDREEGLFLADRLALLFRGSIEAIGPPREIFEHPPSERSATFLGYNVLSGPDGPVAVLPEELLLTAPAVGEPDYTVRASGPVGAGYLSVLEAADGRRLEARTPGPLRAGERVAVGWRRGVPLLPGPSAQDPAGGTESLRRRALRTARGDFPN